MHDDLYSKVTLAMAMGGDPADGVATGVALIQRAGAKVLPDTPTFREALKTWGVEILGAGPPIQKMFSTDPHPRRGPAHRVGDQVARPGPPSTPNKT